MVQRTLQKMLERRRDAVFREQLPNFQNGDYVLVACAKFQAGDKMALRWSGPRHVLEIFQRLHLHRTILS